MDSRKRSWRTWPLWAVLALLVLYPLSFGPAFWISTRMTSSARTFGVLGLVYRPIVVGLLKCPRTIQEPAAAYLNFGADKTAVIYFFEEVPHIPGGYFAVGMVSEHPGFTYAWLSYGHWGDRPDRFPIGHSPPP